MNLDSPFGVLGKKIIGKKNNTTNKKKTHLWKKKRAHKDATTCPQPSAPVRMGSAMFGAI